MKPFKSLFFRLFLIVFCIVFISSYILTFKTGFRELSFVYLIMACVLIAWFDYCDRSRELSR
jgi:hypothetical protein